MPRGVAPPCLVGWLVVANLLRILSHNVTRYNTISRACGWLGGWCVLIGWVLPCSLEHDTIYLHQVTLIGVHNALN